MLENSVEYYDNWAEIMVHNYVYYGKVRNVVATLQYSQEHSGYTRVSIEYTDHSQVQFRVLWQY